ncbi:MAG TPA: hypothetical protein V6C76_06475 [Drouetiella sp.]
MKFKSAITTALFTAAIVQSTVPANAMMLQGGVQRSTLVQPQMAQPMLSGAASAEAQRSARAQVLEGNWTCMSQVTGSNVPGVTSGTVVHSMVQYRPDGAGNMVESWFQNNWTPATSAVVKLDSAVLTSSRESASNTSNGWTARCHDIYKIVAPNKMIAESIVHQFVNGTYVGDYKTQSVLTKSSS